MSPQMQWLGKELSHPVLFDECVEAARNACVAGASIVAAAITAAAYCDSPVVGLPALQCCMQRLSQLDADIGEWCRILARSEHTESAFAPGFGYVSVAQSEYLLGVCQRLLHRFGRTGRCANVEFYLNHHQQLTQACGPLHPTGLVALHSVDRRLTFDAVERWFLSWRIESSVRQAQCARELGLNGFSLLTEQHVYEGQWPARPPVDAVDVLRVIGLELGG